MPADPRTFGVAKTIAFALVPVIVLVAAAELVVRATGVATRCADPLYVSPMWACDPILFFQINPALKIDGQPLNRLGFRDREFEPKKPATTRVVTLGDSCTFGVLAAEFFSFLDRPYPRALERIGAGRLGDRTLEVLNAGIPGYNSYHGIMLLRSKLRALQPDVITVRYGWNDHFVSQAALGTFREIRNPVARGVEDLLLRTSLYPYALRLGIDLRFRLAAVSGARTRAQFPKTWVPTIPLDEYKQNLRRIVEVGRAQGAEVWLLTSPHAALRDLDPSPTPGTPAWTSRMILGWNAIPSFERLMEIHDAYNEASREVGAELGAPVVDMARIYEERADPELFSHEDVCHPTQKGHDLEAAILFKKLVADQIIHPTY